MHDKGNILKTYYLHWSGVNYCLQHHQACRQLKSFTCHVPTLGSSQEQYICDFYVPTF